MRGSILYLALYFFLTSTFNTVIASSDWNDETGWKAGVARVVITPQQSMWMAGYASRTGPSEGKLHDLWAKALALEDASGAQAVLVTADLVGLPKHISDNICNRAQEKFKLSRAQIILNSSHTHSGPVLQDALFDIYPLDADQLELIKAYSDWLEDQMVELIGEALSALEPAQLYANNGIARFQVNRRNNHEDSFLEQTELNGPNDYAVPVIKVESGSGKLMAIAFGYACHPTVLDTTQWSGDYPGFAQAELEALHPGTTAMFFQGAGGDQNPMPRKSVALARQFGRTLASSVERVLEEEMQTLSPKLLTTYSEVDLTLKKPSEGELKRVEAEFAENQWHWADRILEKTRKAESLKPYSYPLQIWGLGEQLVVSLGGEPVVGYAIGLKRMLGPNTFIMGYSNDVMAYIPTTAILWEGGYEGLSSQMAYGIPGKWHSNIEPLIYGEVLQMAQKLGVAVYKERP
ncbi:MAG: neutral/alkaline non-lysosomal ceramidase N-terminal domain-containing protein, partial [Cyclobacteriaceae bacterium]